MSTNIDDIVLGILLLIGTPWNQAAQQALDTFKKAATNEVGGYTAHFEKLALALRQLVTLHDEHHLRVRGVVPERPSLALMEVHG